MQTIAEKLADFVSETRTIPVSARESAIKCVLDLTTAAIAGFPTPNALAVRRVAPQTWGIGPASIWFTSQRLAAPGAAFVNAACACSLDLDDGHRTAAGHPGASVIPAVLAALDVTPSDTESALTAIALGYEIGVRISAARDLKRVPTTNTGLWGGQAAAAAVGALVGLPPGQIAQAISIAGNTAPCQSATAYTKFRGNSAKEGIPWAAANGLLAARLAEQDFTGPVDILDVAEIYAEGTLLRDLGTHWHIEKTYYKPYSCCRWNHAPVDALLALMAAHAIDARTIERIDVDTFGRAMTLGNEPAPSTLEGAQYSIPFCLGVAANHGAAALLPLGNELLSDTRSIEIARRVNLRVVPEFDAAFPAAVPGRVRITTSAGTFEQTVLDPKGEPSNPMGWSDLEAKFDAIADHQLDRETRRTILNAVAALRGGDIAPLKVALSTIYLAEEASAPPRDSTASSNRRAAR